MTSRKKSKPGPFVTALRRMRGGASSHFSGNADACATRGRLAGLLRGEGGQALILVALSLTGIMGAMALAIDVGNLHYRQEQLQNAAEAAALAGALEVGSCGGTSSSSGGPTSCTEMQTAGTSSVKENGLGTPTLASTCNPSSSGTGVVLAVNWGPCAMGSSSNDPNYKSGSYVEAVVMQNVPSFFGGIFGHSTVLVVARSEAKANVTPGSASSGPCDLTLGSGQSVTVNPGAVIEDASGSTCGMQVNSTETASASGSTDCGSTPAMMVNGTISVASTDVGGNACINSGGSISPAAKTGAPPVADPYAAEITAGTLTVPSKGTTQDISTVSGTTTLSPGYYPNGINFNGSGYTVTLSPGVYYMGGSINVGGITLTGTGVTIYMASGGLTMNSAATVSLTAPSSGDTAGLVIWQSSSDSSAMILDSASNSSWGGAIYVPSAQLTLNGGSYATSYGMVISNTLMANSTIALSCSSMPGGVCPGGSSSSGGSGTTTASLAE